jgi:predicted nuclease with RNAse H fold
MDVIGIDLAALPKNATGAAVYDGARFGCLTRFEDEDIIDFILRHSPEAVAIDAPLSLPFGRCCFDDRCCGPRKIRTCDRLMIGMGYRVFPPGYSFMKELTMRGIGLRRDLEPEGIKVIEVHPGTTKRILGLGRFREAKNEHEDDACAAALTAYLYLQGRCMELAGADGTIVIPR